MSAPTISIPGYVAGSWAIDTANSDVSFVVRHLGIAKVHGRFNHVTGEIVTGLSIGDSSVSAWIDAASIDTGFPGRDTYLKGADVLATDRFPELRFASTTVRPNGDDSYLLDGELTIRDITRLVTLTVELGGFGVDPTKRETVLGVSATTTFQRADFGLSRKVPAAVISDAVTIRLDIQASLTK